MGAAGIFSKQGIFAGGVNSGQYINTHTRQTIGLCMIVKNEVSVIERCLASVRPWLDFWLIVDTGSTDGTQAKILEVMADMPGELHERPWRNFGANRTEAIK